ncbi:MAG: hypothetical protein OXC14_15355 [Rhodospirillaceae bacterium]|nr:hypothetical protein [Rhodospirillaceae bacterium]
MPAAERNGDARELPATFFWGAAIIVISEILLALDVAFRGGAVAPYEAIPSPDGVLPSIARGAAVFLTPLCWTGLLFLLDGLLHRCVRQGTSPIRNRPWRFAAIYLISIPVWLIFDWVNFRYIGAWRYHGLPEDLFIRYAGYFLAFGAICPGMFLIADIVQRTRVARLRGPVLAPNAAVRVILIAAGGAMALYPFLVRDPVGSLTLWLGWFFLLDPINERIGAPSIFGDWRQGRYGRTVSLMAAGAICGLLWEFWNYWAVTKWTYNLPFLGPLEEIAYFEMPALGFLGFLPFALECWAMVQTILWLARSLGLRRIKPLPSADAIT